MFVYVTGTDRFFTVGQTSLYISCIENEQNIIGSLHGSCLFSWQWISAVDLFDTLFGFGTNCFHSGGLISI